MFTRRKEEVAFYAHMNSVTEEEISSVYENAREVSTTTSTSTLERWIGECLSCLSRKRTEPDGSEWNKREQITLVNRNRILTNARMKAYVRELESRSCDCVIA